MSYDIWFYSIHRMFHLKNLYLYHKKHHIKTYPTWKDTFYADKLENTIMGLGSLLPALFLVGDHHIIHHKRFNCNYREMD